MTAFARLCELAATRKHHVGIRQSGKRLKAVVTTKNGVDLAVAEFDPSKPDAAALRLAEILLVEDQIR